MTRRGKGGLGAAILLAGAAAFGYYKYSQMSAQEKQDLKDKARRAYEDNVPEHLRNMLGGNKGAGARSNGAPTTPGAYTRA